MSHSKAKETIVDDREKNERRYLELLRKWGSRSYGKMWKPTTPLAVKVEAEQLREKLKQRSSNPLRRVKHKRPSEPTGKHSWRIVYRDGSVAVVKADDYASARNKAARTSYIKIRDIVLMT